MECRASLNISRNLETGVITLTKVDMRHNHVVSKRFENQYACNRQISEVGCEDIKKLSGLNPQFHKLKEYVHG